MGKIFIVVPLLNDWQSCAKLADALVGQLNGDMLQSPIDLVISDDSSVSDLASQRDQFPDDPRLVIRAVRSPSTNGHQQAIAFALRSVAREVGPNDSVVVMDADGEDRPDDVGRLVSALAKSGASVVTAVRGKRSEPLAFRMFYRAYRILFALLTGKSLANGNFMVLSQRALAQVIPRQTVGVHFAATVLRHGGPVSSVVCDRGTRYFGTSKMNRRSLMLHAFAGISTYGDLVALRLASGAFFLLVGSILSVGVSVLVRLFTNLAIPGWATYVSLGFFALAVQALVVTLTALVLFITATAAAARPLADEQVDQS